MLPSERSGTPFRAAETPVTSSGSDVPMATTDSPMMIDGTPSAAASACPESTRRRLPTTMSAAPSANRPIALPSPLVSGSGPPAVSARRRRMPR